MCGKGIEDQHRGHGNVQLGPHSPWTEGAPCPQLLGLGWAGPLWADAIFRALWDGEREPPETGDGAVGRPSPGPCGYEAGRIRPSFLEDRGTAWSLLGLRNHQFSRPGKGMASLLTIRP